MRNKKTILIIFLFLCSTLTVWADEPVGMTIYVKNLQQKVKINWKTKYLKTTNYRVITKFKVSKNGDLISTEILESSGNIFLDNAALSAIEHSQPFQPFPPEFNHEDIDINLNFNYIHNYRKLPNCRFINSQETQKVYKKFPKERKAIFIKEIKSITSVIYSKIPFAKYPNRQKVKVSFILFKDGTTSDLKIIKKSKYQTFDDSVIKSLANLNIPEIAEKLNLDQIKCTYEIISAIQD